MSASRRCGTSRCLIFRCDAASQPSGAAQWAISFSLLFILYLKCFVFLCFFFSWVVATCFGSCLVEIHHQRSGRLNIQTARDNCFTRIKTTETVGATQGNMHLVWFPALFVTEEICLIADAQVLGNAFYVFHHPCEENTYYDIHCNDFAVSSRSTGGGSFAGWLETIERHFSGIFLDLFKHLNVQMYVENIELSDFYVCKMTFS